MGGPDSLDFSALRPRLQRLARDLYSDLWPPEVAVVRQRLDTPRLDDIEGSTAEAVRRIVAGSERRGPVAVGVGSRGIANLERIVRCVIAELKASGFEPFIVPAMGSHGGAVAEGQREILADYGISEERVGAPVRATMETTVLGEVDGVPVHWDRIAAETGRAFLVTRVKPHTDFDGPIESGLSKMAVIGLGKQRGAQIIHSAGVRGLRDVMPAAARLIESKGLLLGGLGIVENARDETAEIHGLRGPDIAGDYEAEVLARAKELMPRIPFDSLHVLVVDAMGKDISGAGMDTNVLGRWRIPGVAEDARPQIACVVTLDLTPASHGNAAGLGNADIVPIRLAEKVDIGAFYTNSLTAGIVGLERAKLPAVLATDRDCVLAAAAVSGRTATEPLRLAWIQDTLHTEALAVSADLLDEVRSRPDLELVSEARPMPFDGEGRLQPFPEFAGD